MSDDRRYTDPATTRLPSTTAPTPTPQRSGWVADPDEPSGWRWIRDLTSISAATHILPTVPTVPTVPEGRVDFQGAVDWAWPPDGEDAHLPGDDPFGDALSGDLGTVTDVEWRDAHERLIADLPDAATQLAYTWTPGVPAAPVDEPDMAPVDGEYDPDTDERLHGGGFLG